MTDKTIEQSPELAAAEARVAQWHEHIKKLLGRDPRGLRDVAALNSAGEPAVIRVASVVAGKPFPTLYWLVDPDISLAIDRLEAGGAIARMQAQVDASPELQAQMAKDHEQHKRHRAMFMSDEEVAFLEKSGMKAALDERGIGGIAEPSRIRCFHTWYGSHLVQPNTIGKMVDLLLNESDANTL